MTAPTTMRGYLDDQLAFSWGSLVADVADTVPDCLWPASNETYRQMRRHHQLASVLGAYGLPIRRASSALNPAGCRDEVVKLVADDLGLPVAGQDTPGAARVRGVSWPDHLRLALLSVVYGHSGFEMLAEIRDGKARLIELSERLPTTIGEIHVDKVGRFAGVTQLMYTGKRSPQIRADQMVWHAREREGAAWWGQSLLRPAYPAWLLSREMLRVTATGHRRFSVGVPTGEWDPGVNPSPAQHADLQRAVSAARVGENSGVAMPPGAHMKLVGLSGSVPDTLAFIRYLDQAMSRMALAGFLDLGTTDTGSRALAAEFIDLFLLAIQADADAIADTVTRQVAARIVEWNWGLDEPVPAVQIGDVGAKHEVTAEALKMLLDSGALQPDPALEAHIRRQFKLPEREGMALPAPSVQGDTVAAANRPARARTSRRKEPAPGQLALPIAAATPDATPDYEQIQQDWDTARTDLLEHWPDTADDLAADLTATAAATVAAGALTDLGTLTAGAVTVAAIAAVLAAAMTPLAAASTALATTEAAALGLAPPNPPDAAPRIDGLAAVFAGQIAAGYAQAASRKAILLTGAETVVAAAIRAHLDDISSSKAGLVADAIGAALTAAQNTGRAAVLSRLDGVVFVADESGDAANRCEACSLVDKTEYSTWAEAEAAYPVIGYFACLGGARCRGQLRVKLAN